MSHTFYRAPWEVTPRAVASGSQNVVKLGAAVVNQRPYVPDYVIARSGLIRSPMQECPSWGCSAPPPTTPATPVLSPVVSLPPIFQGPLSPYYGATATAPQPPPPATPTGLYVSSQQTTTGTPMPAPVVSVPSSQTAPSLPNPGTVLDTSGNSPTVSTATGIGAWLEQSTLIAGLPNWGIAAAGIFGLMLFMGKKR